MAQFTTIRIPSRWRATPIAQINRHRTNPIGQHNANRRTSPHSPLRLSAEYVEFNLLFGCIVGYLPDNAERLAIAAAEVSALNAAYGNWGIAYEVYADPARRTSAAIAQMRMEYKKDLRAVHGMRQAVKHNNQITLTAEDYRALGIHHDKTTRTSVPRQECCADIAGIQNQSSGEYLSRHLPRQRRRRASVFAVCESSADKE